MKEIKNDFMLFSVLSQTLELMRKSFGTLTGLSIFALAIPGMIHGVYFRAYSHSTVEAIRAMTEKMASGAMSNNYELLLRKAQEFALLYLPFTLLLVVLLVTMYVVSTLVALENLEYFKLEYQNRKELLFKAMRLAFPKAFIIMLVALFIGRQFGLMRVFGVLLLMGVNLMLVEGKGAFASLWQALTFRYASYELGNRLRVFGSIAVIVVVLYLMDFGLLSLGKFLLSLDRSIFSLAPIWNFRPYFLPSPVIHMLMDGIYFLYSLLVMFFLSHYLSCLYVATSKRPSERK